MANTSDLDVEKAEVEQVEDVLNRPQSQAGPVGLLERMQKRNPSLHFLAEVAKMNETELDPQRVKQIERKIDLLIMPALTICYMVRCLCSLLSPVSNFVLALQFYYVYVAKSDMSYLY